MKPLEPLAVPLAGTQLVEASAGTGKTHTITTLYVRLLLERRLRPEQILVVTFTNAATAELKDRIRARIRSAVLSFEARGGDDPELTALVLRSENRAADAALLRDALRSLDEAAVFTIHGFCQRVLAEHAFESGVAFGQELVADQLPLLLEVVQDFQTRELYAAADAEILYLGSRGGLGGLISLARVALAWPNTPILPETDGESAAAAVADFLAARARVGALWSSARADTERLVRRAGLNKRSYTPELVTSSLFAIDALFARRDASIEGWTKACERWTATTLQQSTNKGFLTPEHSFFGEMERLGGCHRAAAEALERWYLGVQQRLVRFVRTEMPRRKAERGVLSFDDLLQQLSRALSGRHGAALAARLCERHHAVLVDEFQDTDPVQYEIFRSAFGARGATLFLIGDPKQAIYAFRGADVFAYLAAARDAGEAAWTLSTNWRSDPGLVAAVNGIFGRLERPFLLDDIGYHPIAARPGARDLTAFRDRDRAPLEIVFLPRKLAGNDAVLTKKWGEARIPSFVAGHVSRLLSSGATIDGQPIVPGDIAVLTRTNDQARQVQLELRALSIPSVMHGDASVLDAAEARELARVLAALSEPSNAARVRAALATTLLGLGADQIERLRDDESEWEAWMDGFSRWNATWSRQGFVQAFRRLMRDTGMASRLLSLVDGDRRLTNVLHLVELLHQEAARRRLGMAGLMQWFDDVRFDRMKRESIASEAQQVRLERDDRAVQLTTVHRSKGLEYPIVYAPYLWTDGGLFNNDKRLLRYHDPDDGLRFKIDVRRPEDKDAEVEIAEQEAKSESLRLAYVALTRAKHRSIVFWGVFRQSSSPLAHLLHPRLPKLSVLDDRRVIADLDGLIAESADNVEVVEVDPEPGTPLPPSSIAAQSLAARSFARKLVRTWRTSSFSALAAAEAALSVPAVVGRDVDEHAEDSPVALAEPIADELVRLHAFPRGARAGDLIHYVLEHLDFDAERGAIAESVALAFDRHGFAAIWQEPLVEAIAEVVQTRLVAGPNGPRLCDVPRAARLSELEFVFPVTGPNGRALSPPDLAAVLERHRSPEIPADYVARVARLGFEPLAGYLRGFIDLVFEHDGAFYVADYKSNHLGPRPDDYRADRVAEAMAHHHYHLQYLIYSVALHRFLRARRPGYDFDRHFGGALYLFLRGMQPSSGATRGVFFARPSRALVEALSALLGGGNA